MIAAAGPYNSTTPGGAPLMGPATESRVVSAFYRGLLLLIPLVGLAAWAVLARLDPAADGLGTHQQLGLAPCPTLARKGQPCPTCGMTTAAAWLARGNIQKAAGVNTAALPLCGLAVFTAFWSTASALKGRPVGFSSWDRPLELWAGGLFSIAAATWAVRLCQWQSLAAGN